MPPPTCRTATAYSLAQWLGRPKWKPVLWIIAAAAIPAGNLPRNVVTTFILIGRETWQKCVFPLNLVLIPLLLWAAAAIAGRKERTRPPG